MGTALGAWLQKWQVSRRSQVGAGSFETLCTGIDQSKQVVAIRIQKHEHAHSATEFGKDFASLIVHPHPNIICLCDFVLDITNLTSGIAVEVSATDLRRFMHINSTRLARSTAHFIGQQLVAGVAHLHRQINMHGEITPQHLYLCITARRR